MGAFRRQYGEATTIQFPLPDAGTEDFEATPVTHAAGDTQISKDEAAFANTTNAFVHEGNGTYSIALTATEMQAKRIMVTIIDQTATKEWQDQAVIVETVGHPSAQHPNEGIPLPDSGLITGTPTSTTAALGGNLPATNDIVNGTAIYFSAGTGSGQTRQIVDYDTASDTVTVDPAWTTTPDTTTVYHLVPAPPSPTAAANLPQVEVASIIAAALADMFDTNSGTTYASAVAGSVVKEIADNAGGSALTEAGIADAVWDEAQADHVAAGSFGIIASEIASILTDTAEIGAAGAGLTEAGGTGDQFTAVPWNAAWDAEVQSEVNDGLVAYDAATGADITALNDPTAAAIVSALMAEVIENTVTVKQAMSLWNAAAAGKATGMGTTSAALRNLADTIDRIAATVDTDGNRSAVTTTFTDL